MVKYKATNDVYLCNSKASIVFRGIYHTPRNEYEVELLEEGVKQGIVKKEGKEEVKKEKQIEKKKPGRKALSTNKKK